MGDGILVAIVATEKQKVIVFNPKYPNRSFCDVPLPCLLCNFFGSSCSSDLPNDGRSECWAAISLKLPFKKISTKGGIVVCEILIFAEVAWASFLFLPPFFLVFAIIIFYALKADKKYCQQLEAEAVKLGFEFSKDKDLVLFDRLSTSLGIFDGQSKSVRHVLKAETEDSTMTVFHFSVRKGNSSSSYQILAFEKVGLEVPQFQVRSQVLFEVIGALGLPADRIKGVLGMQDIDFQDHQEFSDAYILQGENEDAIRQFFGPTILDLFVNEKFINEKSLEVAGAGNLVAFRKKGSLQPEELQNFVSEAYELLHALDLK